MKEVLARLETMGDEKLRAQAVKRGAGQNQFGVKMGDIRVLAKEIKSNQPLALELWKTGNTDAMLLAVLLMKPKELSKQDFESMLSGITFSWLADWVNSYLIKQHPQKELFREEWMNSGDPMIGRAGWSLTAERVAKTPEGVDLKALLERIEKEAPGAPEPMQWTMNFTLAEIGINHPELRERAITLGEKLGMYRDYPVSKGCTSPFAPIWIKEISGRKG